ncbi:haloacid dehalogenase [Dictyobacter alpinus]|uniref:Haloacid dehalogenase n=1 Tax=Dictyobacter alpinus TaxID=2014873 RepID=A0A402BI66_9CHLR|nr:HAD family hydrolase [Dictyobacter alpinus]GCE31094.1 haloacid dehalogenase [Dictyobacter alpinus]
MTDQTTSTYEEPLQSWQDGATRTAIINFVQRVTDSTHPAYVPPAERIAAFDNDGTLWCEKPTYVQEIFIIKHFHNQVEQQPELRHVQPYKAFWENDRSYFETLDMEAINQLMLQAISSIPQAEYIQRVQDFFRDIRHPHYNRPVTELAFTPMLELIEYLNAYQFQIYIVTGGETDFVREISEKMYGIPRSKVIGSSVAVKFELHNGRPVLVRQMSMLEPFNEGEGKAINIHHHIGQQPILAVGNSNGDLDMLLYIEDQQRSTLPLLIHHDDAEREFAYEEGAERALKAAAERNWNIISMKNDFKRIFSFVPERVTSTSK